LGEGAEIKALKAMEEIGKYIASARKVMDLKQVSEMMEMLVSTYQNSKKVLIVGAGRSGLVGKAFAMRLMHLGFKVYVLGETITPRVEEGDLVIAISGSGSTELVVATARIAKRLGAKIIAITSFPNSPLGKVADHVIYVPGRSKISKEKDYVIRQILGLHEPLAPLGTLFEDTAMAFLDGVVTGLMERLGKSEDEMLKMHANVELP